MITSIQLNRMFVIQQHLFVIGSILIQLTMMMMLFLLYLQNVQTDQLFGNLQALKIRKIIISIEFPVSSLKSRPQLDPGESLEALQAWNYETFTSFTALPHYASSANIWMWNQIEENSAQISFFTDCTSLNASGRGEKQTKSAHSSSELEWARPNLPFKSLANMRQRIDSTWKRLNCKLPISNDNSTLVTHHCI